MSGTTSALVLVAVACLSPLAQAESEKNELTVGHGSLLYDHPLNATISTAFAFANSEFGMYLQADVQLQRVLLFGPVLEPVTQAQRFFLLRMGALPLKLGPLALGFGGHLEGVGVSPQGATVGQKENLGGVGGELTVVFQPVRALGFVGHVGKQYFSGDTYRSFVEAHVDLKVLDKDFVHADQNFGVTLAVTKSWFAYHGEPWAPIEYLAGIGIVQ